MTFDVSDNSCPPQLKKKLFKEQRNLCRKQDLKPVNQTNKWAEKAKSQLTAEEEENKTRPIMPQHGIEVDVEINIIENSDGQKTPSNPVKHFSKCRSTTPQRVRRKPCTNAAAADVSSPSRGDDAASIISETAAKELSDLRNYYSKQLRRINYISHEYLGQPSEPGVLTCIREPLRSLRLPRRVTIAQSARSLWTLVSGRRKLGHW